MFLFQAFPFLTVHISEMDIIGHSHLLYSFPIAILQHYTLRAVNVQKSTLGHFKDARAALDRPISEALQCFASGSEVTACPLILEVSSTE